MRHFQIKRKTFSPFVVSVFVPPCFLPVIFASLSGKDFKILLWLSLLSVVHLSYHWRNYSPARVEYQHANRVRIRLTSVHWSTPNAALTVLHVLPSAAYPLALLAVGERNCFLTPPSRSCLTIVVCISMTWWINTFLSEWYKHVYAEVHTKNQLQKVNFAIFSSTQMKCVWRQ